MTTVLLVDDEPQMTPLVTMCLEELGVEVLTAATPAAALDAVRAAIPAAILLDLQLGPDDGLRLLAELRDERGMADVPVVVFSVHDHRRVEAMASGVSGFVGKPFRAGVLRNALRGHLEGDRRSA